MLEIETKKLRLTENTMLRTASDAGLYYAFDLEKGDHFDLNETSFWLLEQIGQGISFKDLLERFIVEFELSREVAMTDLVETVDFAITNSIVEEISE
ncbi:hypothetical protein KAR91_63665 [Candidatus Pacearchaeota archaeon]|nr:hypothetical protein [Candidatus Pacearchaeota archaeon]